MRQMWLTLQERQLLWLLRWWTGLFAGATVIFAVFPEGLIYWINAVGHTIFKWPYRSLPEPAEHFWQVLAVSLLVVLTYIAFEAQREIRENFSLVRIIIVSKFVTSAGFLLAFVLDGTYFAYLVGLAVDFLIFALTWFCYHRAAVSKGI